MKKVTHQFPKLHIQRSWLLDQALARPKNWPEPKVIFFKTQVRKLMRSWDKDGHMILRSIERHSGRRWHQREIPVYVSYSVRPFSNPLTLSLKKDVTVMVDTLTHELIHRILSEPQNWKQIENNWNRLMRIYRKESPIARTHIVVHAIHELVLLELFGQKRLVRERQEVKNPAYRRSWKIVERDGAAEIVRQLRRKPRAPKM